MPSSCPTGADSVYGLSQLSKSFGCDDLAMIDLIAHFMIDFNY